jgi:molybdate transport system regulatory protein
MEAPRLWIKIYFGDRGQVGPGTVRLLRAIAEHRSISAAARAEGMSYRRAWVLVDQMNRTFGRPVAATHTGGRGRGGAELTPLGEEIVRRYSELVARAAAAGEAELAGLSALIRAEDWPPPPPAG